MSITDAIREIQWWLRLATFLVCPLQIALLFVLHNKGNRIDYSGLPEDETELYKEFLRRKVEIDKLVKDGVLNKAQHDTLLPPGQNKTDSSVFDVTLIIVLIINFTTLPPPKKGWKRKSDPTDTSIAAYVIKARKWRNALIHDLEPRNLSKPEFHRIWDEGEIIVKGLGLTTFDTKALKNINLDVRNSIVLNSILTYKTKIQGTLDAHVKEFAIINGHLRSIKVAVDDLNSKFDDVMKEVDDLKDVVVNVNTRVEGIKEEVNDVNSKIVVVTVEVDGVNSKVDNVKETADGVNSKVDGIKEAVDGVNSKVDNFKEEVDGMNSKIGDVTEVVNGVNSKVDGVNSRVDDVIESVDHLKTKVDSIKDGYREQGMIY